MKNKKVKKKTVLETVKEIANPINLPLNESDLYQRVLCLVFGHSTTDGYITWKDDKGVITLQFRVCQRCSTVYFNQEKVPVGESK